MRGDPYYLKLKWAGRCSCCGKECEKGEEVLYFPRFKKFQCFESGKCNEDNHRVLSAIADEDAILGGM